MSRILAALFVVAACTVFTLAEEEKPPVRFPFGPGTTTLPFDIVQQDGKTAWKVTGKGSLRVEDLIGGLASAHSLRVTYSQRAAGKLKENVPYVGPDGGVVIGNTELADYASDLLASTGLTIVGASTGKARVLETSEAPTYALYVSEAELEKLPATEWAMVRGMPRFASVATIAMVAQARARGDGAVTMRVEDSGYVIIGMAGQVRVMLRLIRDADVAGAGADGKLVRVYDVPAAIKADAAASIIESLFEESSQSVHNVEKNIVIQTRNSQRVNVRALPTNNRIIVRATAGDQSLVQGAIEAMK